MAYMGDNLIGEILREVTRVDAILVNLCQNYDKANSVGSILFIVSFVAIFPIVFIFRNTIWATILPLACMLILLISFAILYYAYRAEKLSCIRKASDYPAVMECTNKIKIRYGIENDIQPYICNEKWKAEIGPYMGEDAIINLVRWMSKKPLKYTLIISSEIASWPSEWIETVIGHELSHVVHGDARTLMLLRIMTLIDAIGVSSVALMISIYLFVCFDVNKTLYIIVLPLVLILVVIILWRKLRYMSREIEARCDSDAVLITGKSTIYHAALQELYNHKKVGSVSKFIRKIIGGDHPKIEDRLAHIDWINMHFLNR